LLLLTHLTSWTDPVRALEEARAAFEGNTVLVAPGDSYEV
jgi:ribonuclease BN (tRNA processing enzyme)